ncbi:hypothetical protein [Legionella micdadei]|uniref:Uncharacterized protein n=1 Tax=Legionella micdadei TaxID=451 RepID=A0A098GIN9_LEGMI|nr:hypothetical protein [Legionella micdadei]ARG96756.1 hypothetical protein B6N58_03230 [Legionella micdadei]KTD26424.1 hypothetical protein Lmic_2518 [Legionella micdadei]NSL17983.1 hypothetical protein [Legionella micdadei]CEG61862.1 protein of unknown function [Legionella micdadei]SCY25764.1 hypothetical protein SAMN02982997_01234 [Legionella micdadei]
MDNKWVDASLISEALIFREKMEKDTYLNYNVPVTPAHLEEQLFIKVSLNQISEYKVTSEHLLHIIGSWHLHQYLITISEKTDLSKLKQKINEAIKHMNKAIKLMDETHQQVIDNELVMFSYLGVNYSSLHFTWNFDQLNQLVNNFNRKQGSPFNKERIIKHAYFELIFIAEALGITPPTQNYESSQFKTYLKIFLDSLDIQEKTLEYYYQQYAKAKNNDLVALYKIEALIELAMEFHDNVSKWKNLLPIYREQIAPLLLSK